MTNLKKTILAAGVALLALGAAHGVIEYNKMTSTPPAVITLNGGGNIFEFIDQYNVMEKTGQQLEVRGPCASACTFFLGLLPKEQVCYGKNVYLGFHGVYKVDFAGNMSFDPIYTKWTYEYVYTPEVLKALNETGWSIEVDVNREKYPTGLIWKGQDFMKSLGYQKCDG